MTLLPNEKKTYLTKLKSNSNQIKIYGISLFENNKTKMHRKTDTATSKIKMFSSKNKVVKKKYKMFAKYCTNIRINVASSTILTRNDIIPKLKFFFLLFKLNDKILVLYFFVMSLHII